MTDRDFWFLVRQAILLLIDAIERWQGIEPRTAELRRERKRQAREEG